MAAPPPGSGGAAGWQRRRYGPEPGSTPAAPRSRIMAAASAAPPTSLPSPRAPAAPELQLPACPAHRPRPPTGALRRAASREM